MGVRRFGISSGSDFCAFAFRNQRIVYSIRRPAGIYGRSNKGELHEKPSYYLSCPLALRGSARSGDDLRICSGVPLLRYKLYSALYQPHRTAALRGYDREMDRLRGLPDQQRDLYGGPGLYPQLSNRGDGTPAQGDLHPKHNLADRQRLPRWPHGGRPCHLPHPLRSDHQQRHLELLGHLVRLRAGVRLTFPHRRHLDF